MLRIRWRAQARRAGWIALGAAVLASVGAPGAWAAWPDRPIMLVVPFAPGGPPDILARILSISLGQSLGQNVVIDNRAGAAGNIGMGYVARAKPDGYTLLMTSTAIAVNPALFKNLPYDPFKDFAPISELVNAPNVLVVRPDSGINTIADLVAQAKANPAKFNYASPGAGTKSHLTGELLKLRAGIQMVHVPFRGAGPAAQAVLANTTQVGSVALGGGGGADPGRPAARARGDEREALVLAAQRADHDRAGLSRIHLRYVQCLVRARRGAAGYSGDPGARKPGGLPASGGARAGAQGRLRGGRRHARTTGGARGGGNPGGARTGGEGRHQAGVRAGPRFRGELR